MKRRTFLAAATTTVAATIGVARAQYSEYDGATDVFQHGVASGDPLPTAVIIWTRVTTPDPGPHTVTWEVSTDPAFHHVEHAGHALAKPQDDFTVHIDVTGCLLYTSDAADE